MIYRSERLLTKIGIGSLLAGVFGIVVPGSVVAQRTLSDAELRAELPAALEEADVPDMSHIINRYIRNESYAIALGKALFWDEAAGSDGQACASCHFHAGADSRSKNQLNPGFRDEGAGIDTTKFNQMESGAAGGPNYQLVADDFPFEMESPDGDEQNDVVSSQGVFNTTSTGVFDFGSPTDPCDIIPDPVFNVGHVNVRRVEPRNTPTVINSVFNHRNFWDGRANNFFNGNDPHGARGEQGIWEYNLSTRVVSEVNIMEKNSSLASQAVGPPLSDLEMACAGKAFPELGKKMLGRKALADQQVSTSDSVFGPLNLVNTRGTGQGLRRTYQQLIIRAFKREYWGAPGRPDGTYTQMQANFALFWGLAIQLYEATLVSHETPVDAFARGTDGALTELQKEGAEVFLGDGKCINCHGGPEFTGAAVRFRALQPDGNEEAMERMIMGNNEEAVYDGGFYNIGVTRTSMDLCVGADLLGFPLSFSRQASTGNIIDPEANLDAAADDPGVQPGPVQIGERVAVDGACKVPTIRNVELTAPFFHNGGSGSLEDVVDAYRRQFRHLFSEENIDDLDPDILEIDISGGDEDALVAFMEGLTDERVRFHEAPFDHPELTVPNGHPAIGGVLIDSDGDGQADDDTITIPAVGAGGYAAPLPNFLE
ncbi:MAG: cytochrome-c peroxidase [Woeseiaceae bacterium]